MTSTYDKVHSRLKEIAITKGEPIYYTEVANLLGHPKINGHNVIKEISDILDDINRDNGCERPMLSAVVVKKKTGLPRKGFFD